MQSYRVHFSRSQKTIVVEEWLTVVMAARKVGLTIPTDCRHGVCGACEVQTSAGLMRACITCVSPDLSVDL